MNANETRVADVLAAAKRFCKRDRPRFENDNDMLHAARLLFDLADGIKAASDDASCDRLRKRLRKYRRKYGKALRRSRGPAFTDAVRKAALSSVETEILLALVLGVVGLHPRLDDIEALQKRFDALGVDRLTVLQALDDASRLVAGGLVIVDPDEVPVERWIRPAPDLLGRLLRPADAPRVDGVVPKVPSAMTRAPSVRMEQLVLAPAVQRKLDLALTHVRRRDVMLETWGLGKAFAYGRGVILLFSGPPGVGKTAAAEALAHALEKPLLPVDTSRVLDCWLGDTEKNIARLFREARRTGAVVFWDEADSFLADRGGATRSWEVQQVNTLLQELERFDGVCVLATNRTPVLDEALERRVALRIAFPRPDRAMRRRLWETMLPPELPLAADVAVERLSEPDLTGGQIKNAIWNAARIAATRDPQGAVGPADFEEALAMEQQNRWTRRACIGFGRFSSTEA